MTEKQKLVPVVVSGGSGTRLWPISRANYPKQFALQVDGSGLFAQTLQRVSLLDYAKVVVVCNKAHRFFSLEKLKESDVDRYQLLLEPVGRNTAPAFALAMQACQDLGDPLLLFLPSDHLLADNQAFVQQVQLAMEYAAQGRFITFGVKPSHAETGYGYIIVSEQDKGGVREVVAFKEKPDVKQAEQYISDGNCYWNSGIFMCKRSVYQSALEQHAPTIMDACTHSWQNRTVDRVMDAELINFDEQQFSQNPDISIDYAVVEKLSDIVVVPIESAWSDLGSWQAMDQVFEKDGDDNYSHGDVVTYDSHHNTIYSSHRLVTLCGVENQIVAETPDAVLVADRSKAQDIKQLVAKLKEHSYPQSDWHRRVYRPWGSYEGVDAGDNFQVKRLIVNPGQRLSIQRHQKRSEHWVVVKGIARVTVGEKTFDVHVNESVCIPVGTIHCLENCTEEPLWLIEVQCGSYLGEDDIERLDDIYGRTDGKVSSESD